MDLSCYIYRDYGELASYFFEEYYLYIRPCIAELRENKNYYKIVIIISFKKYQLEITELLVQINMKRELLEMVATSTPGGNAL